MKRILSITILIGILLGGCSTKSLVPVRNFTDGVHTISSDLLAQTGVDMVKNKTIVFTSMVDIDNMEHSSKFGRLFSESLMTDFKIRGWRVIEYRGTDIVSRSQNGEFMLNRGRLQNIDQGALILVGTYGLYNGDLVVNTRLVSSDIKELVSAASVTIHDRNIVDMAYTHNQFDAKKIDEAYTIDVKGDDCDETGYCWRILP
ncbi:MAG: FlgO family outer membrane protein [Campylobacterota bacterium]|nr:FlgO family outer membrane protein [Campylobacterota bacterium]